MAEDKGKKKERKETFSEKEFVKKVQEELDKLTVKDVVLQMFTTLANLGYKKLGFPASVGNKKSKDLDQARLAIDSLSALLGVLENYLQKEEINLLKSTLSDLQMLYVSESSK